MEKTRPRAQVALLPKRSSKTAREAIPAHDGCKMTFAFPMSVSSHVPSAMHLNAWFLIISCMTITAERKNPHTRRVVRGLAGRPPVLNGEVAHCGSPSRRQSNFFLISFELRVRSRRETTSLSFSIGGRAEVPMICEDFFARR